eukprot:g10036.t2
MALLDACYPFAHKAGLLTDEAVGLKGSEPTQGTCACAVLLLPGALGSAVNLCGVRPLAELPVLSVKMCEEFNRDQDTERVSMNVAGLMQISDGESFEQWRTFSLPRCLEIGNLPYLRQRPSRRSQRMLESVKQTFGWVFHAWQVETLRSYEWRLVQESGLYTHGAWFQLKGALGRLGRAYDLNALATSESSEVPYARLCFAAGPGPIKSVDNDVQLVAFGQALIGCPGTSYPFSGELKRPITTMHRQALGLVMLYSAPSLVPKASGALDTGLWSPLRSKRKQLPFGRSLCYLKSTTPQRPLLVPEVTSHVLGPRGMVFDSEAWLEDVQQKIPDKEAKIVIGCAAGVRSKAAARVLEAAGYLNVQELDDGFNGWAASGHPVGPLAK